MVTTTFRWKPNRLLLAPFALLLTVVGGLALWRVLTNSRSANGTLDLAANLSLAGAALFVAVLTWWVLRRIGGYRLDLTPDALALFRGSRERWRVAWPDLLEARRERGTRTQWDRLVLRTTAGERSVKLDDGLAGRWDDPAALLAALEARGHAVR